MCSSKHRNTAPPAGEDAFLPEGRETSGSPELTSRQIQAGTTKKQIFDTAVALIKEQGYEKTAIKDICLKAGVSIGTFYYYYPSKQNILNELYLRADQFLREHFNSWVVSSDPVERVKEYLALYIHFVSLGGTDAVLNIYYPSNRLFLYEDRYVVTGASNSSRAVLEAVATAVTLAGGNPEALRNRQAAVRGPGTEIVKEADVLVIGGGGAGLAAAVSAAEKGAAVILIEKSPSLGGNTVRAGGAYNAVDPDRQRAVRMTAPLLAELQSLLALPEAEVGEYAPVLRTLKNQIRAYLAGNTGVLFDSVELHIIQTYLGGKRTDRNGSTITGELELVTLLCSNSPDAMLWLENQGLRFDNPIGTVLGALWPRTHGNNQPVGTGFINTLAASAAKLGVEIILECKGEELIRSGNRISGVNGHLADGTPVRINTSRGVVLATGGYGENREMRAQYNTYWPSLPLTMPSTNTPNATGDGIIMGLAAGADLTGMGFVQLMPSSHPETGSLSGGVWGSAEEQVFVNSQGKRFVNEYAERDILASAALEQPKGLFYIIGDQVTSGNPQSGGKNVWGDDIDTLVATQSIYKADTLADLERQLGIPAGNLQAEIARYNGFIDAGVDQDFGKRNFGAKISVPPFYATPRSPSVHHTMGGLVIDGSTRVLDTSGRPIPGLYAAGEVTGGIHAGNRLGGNALVDTQVFGRIAGISAAAGL